MTKIEKWDRRFLVLAKHIAEWSKDESTKVGAVIVDDKNRIISVGYNGFPRGVDDSVERYSNRPVKYQMIVHAEINAMIFANRSLAGCTLYTHPFGPCSRCACQVIQHGISRVVSPTLPHELHERWRADLDISAMMFREAQVDVVEYS